MGYNNKHLPLTFWECKSMVEDKWDRLLILSIFQNHYPDCEHSAFAFSWALVNANRYLEIEDYQDCIIGSFVKSIAEKVHCLKEKKSNALSLKILNVVNESLKKQNQTTDAYIVGNVVFGDFEEMLPYIFKNAFPQINYFYCFGEKRLECKKSILIQVDDICDKYSYICFKDSIIDYHYLFIQDNDKKVNYLLVSQNNFEELIVKIRAGK